MSHARVSATTYFVVFAALLGLLVLTVAAAYLDLGEVLNLVIALAIAGTKALLIAIYFMHLRDSIPLVRLAALAGVVWLSIAGVLTMADYLTR